MKTPQLLIAALIFISSHMSTAFAASQPAAPAHPVKLIFDTDMGNDIDDALALAVIHALQNRGVCELLAVTHTFPGPDSAAYTAAVNTFYGRPDIPVGVSSEAPFVNESKYLQVAQKKDADGRLLYPSDYDAKKAPQSVALLRKTLAAAADREVVMIQVGFSTNLAGLLDSPPDAHSPLPGRELIKQKVKFLSIMAAKFPKDDGRKPEFNVRFDIPAAMKIAAGWPTPIYWSGWEVGNAVRYPAWSIDCDFGYIKNHIIQQSYQAYNPTPHQRPCWDLTSVAIAVWPERGYFTLSPAGVVEFDAGGFSRFSAGKNGRDYYLSVDKEQAARLREAFAALASEPPVKK